MRVLFFICAIIASSIALPAAADGPAADPQQSGASEARTECVPSRRVHCPTPIQMLAAANGAARQRPTRDGFNEARHVYAYAPGALYELYTNPGFISTILLEPGENLNAIAAGDTARWMVTEAQAETDAEPRTIVLVKPQMTGLRTNIVLITDRRTYTIEASAVSGEVYSAQIAWTYPEDDTVAPGASFDRLHFDYRIRTTRGRTPRWLPSRVFDDGRRTWIEMPADIEASDMPPLFVITGEGAELVNYRVQGRRYMVDRIFDTAELRLGARAPIIVRIERRAPTALRDGEGS